MAELRAENAGLTARVAELAGQVARLQESVHDAERVAVRLVVGEGRLALTKERPGWRRWAAAR